MKISDLQTKLATIKVEHGDIEIRTCYPSHCAGHGDYREASWDPAEDALVAYDGSSDKPYVRIK